MNWTPQYSRNQATEEEISRHLTLCDARFIPPLSGRVEIGAYARKIHRHSERFEAWAGDALIGLLAIYCDDLERHVAYITNVSVIESPPSARIASRLLATGIEYLTKIRFQGVELEVNGNNSRAIRLYERHGFVTYTASDQTLFMRLRLDRRSE